MAKNVPFRIKMYEMFENNPNITNEEVAKAFISIGLKKPTVYRWIKQYRETGNIERRIASGPIAKIKNKINIRKLRSKFNHRSGCSQNAVARKYGCTQQYISYLLKKYTHIRCYKKYKRPLLTSLQKHQARPKCRAMYFKYGKQDFIMDDESYFTLDHSCQPGNDIFYSDDISKTPDKVKYDFRKKYPSKLLVWIAISPKGIAKPIFRPSGLAINAEGYLEMIKESLVPFVKEHYSSGGYVFWPDLATSHYASNVQKFLKKQSIPCVLKSINPANVPKARPIEDFWGDLKDKVYKGDWKANNLEELKERILSVLRKMDMKDVQKHIERTKSRLDQIRRHGLD